MDIFVVLGVGLAGIVSTLAGAEMVLSPLAFYSHTFQGSFVDRMPTQATISDYPAPELLSNIFQNVSKNVPEILRPRIYVQGHEWGDLSSSFAQVNAGCFTRILAADCLWMPHEHHNLARSMLHFLSSSLDARVFVIAGFHTGRTKMAPFFEEVIGEEGLEIEEIYEMDANGMRRGWQAERDSGREDIGERKKWLVVVRLRRKRAVK